MKTPKRPLGVTIIAVIYGIAAVLALVQAFTAFATAGYLVAVLLPMAALAAAIAWGLLELTRWGRQLAICITAALFVYTTTILWAAMMNGDVPPVLLVSLRMVVQGSILVYLLQSKIAALFDSRLSASIGINPKNPV